MPPDVNKTSLIAGIVFIIFGVLFLLERLGAIDVSARYIVPILLVALGVALVVGATPKRRGGANGPGATAGHDDNPR